MDESKNDRFLDENLIDGKEDSGQTPEPMPNEEGKGAGKDAKPHTLNPDRPDEFGDGDRRS